MLMLMPSNEEGWHTLFFMAHQLLEEQNWVLIDDLKEQEI
jgi:hypothetical protein